MMARMGGCCEGDDRSAPTSSRRVHDVGGRFVLNRCTLEFSNRLWVSWFFLIENAIRPIALERKNGLFAGSETAGRRAAAIMSLLATAKANGHCPHAWLTDVLTRLPTTLDKNIGELLPHQWKPTALG